MKKFKNSFINFIRENILIVDVAKNVYALEEKKDKSSTKNRVFSTKNRVFNVNNDKYIVDVTKNSFFIPNSQKKGNNVIDFVMSVENVDFVNAVKKISKYYNLNEEIEFDNDNFELNKNLKRNFELKNKNKKDIEKTNANAEKNIYLYKKIESSKFDSDVRCISRSLLNYLVDNNYFKFYKNDKYKVIKTPLIDENDEVVGVQDIFFNEKERKWKKIINGTARLFSVINKNANSVVLTESFFDAVSALQLSYNNKKIKNEYYTYDDLLFELGVVSVNGSLSELKKNVLLKMFKTNKNLETIIFAFDADEIGEKYEKEIYEILKKNDLLDRFKILKIGFGDKKDLNELLQDKYNQDKNVNNKKMEVGLKGEKKMNMNNIIDR